MSATTANAWGASAAGAPLAKLTIARREVGPRDVRIDVKYCGICHSDLHHCKGEWGEQKFPVVPGHEIAGVVEAVGAEVRTFAVGDRVGVGCLVDSCRTCDACRRGEEQYCSGAPIFTYGSVGRDGTLTQGGYSTQVVVDEAFVLRIPEAIPLDVAAPLLCAGITTWSPLRHWGAGPGTRVAVVGLGGLGHMAVKFAHAMGAEVTVLSQSTNKREAAAKLGADHFHSTKDPQIFPMLAGRFDLIINTVSAKLELDAYLSLLAVDGTLVNVGAPGEPLSLSAFSLILKRRAFAGSLIGGIRQTQEMLDFCGRRGIGADIEVIPASGINAAWARVLASDVRYRFVIDVATMR